MSSLSADKLQFDVDDETSGRCTKTSVAAYFRDRYNINLRYVLVCIIVLMAQSTPSVPITLPSICRAFVILFWESYKCPTVGPGIHTKTPRWDLKIGCKCPAPGQHPNCIFQSTRRCGKVYLGVVLLGVCEVLLSILGMRE